MNCFFPFRLTELAVSMRMEVNKKQIHVDAWVAKKFMVLIKRKLQRGQVPRQPAFKSLMSAVFPDDSSSDGDDGHDHDGGNSGVGGDGPDPYDGLALGPDGHPQVSVFDLKHLLGLGG